MCRAIREISPKYVVGENVDGIVNWNGGLIFDEVQSELEDQGYEVLPFILPACAVNAPHRRDRVWFIAHADGTGQGSAYGGTDSKKESDLRRGKTGDVLEPLCGNGPIALSERSKTQKTDWGGFPTQLPLYFGDDGVSPGLDGIAVLDWQKQSLKAAGNAVVPQIVYEIFKAIENTEKL